MLSIMIFFLGAMLIAAASARTFSDPRSHGFYRFLAFEAIWAIIVMNAQAWFVNVLAVKQLISWTLLFCSLLLALHAFYLFRVVGRPTTRTPRPTHFRFEETATLVNVGAYRYIRHPMYASLLLLTWGAAFKTLSFFSILLALAAAGLLVLTARAEEFENLERFGEEYDQYMSRTKMFIPYMF